MFKQLLVSDFKSFSSLQRIPLSSLNFVVGPNSAGKSSVIHSLLLAHEAARLDDFEVHATAKGGDAVDLGGFRQYVHRHDSNRRISLSLSWPGKGQFSPAACVKATFGYPRLADRALDQAGAAFLSGSLTIDEVLLAEFERDGSGQTKISFLNAAHPHLQFMASRNYLTRKMLGEKSLDFQGLLLNASRDLLVETQGPFVTGIAEADGAPSRGVARVARSRRNYYARLHPSGNDQLEAAASCLDRTLGSVWRDLNQQLEGMHYLGPLRAFPPRHLASDAPSEGHQDASGAHAWDLLRADEELRQKVNLWLSSPELLATSYRLLLRHLVDAGEATSLLSNEFDRITASSVAPAWEDEEQTEVRVEDLDEFKDYVLSGEWRFRLGSLSELVLTDSKTNTQVSHRDVGTGVSQVLPVLAYALSQTDSFIAIEQPEVHLHPELQARLGDLFITSALGESKNAFLLETHSENVLLRILRRVRETSRGTLPEGLPGVTPDDISVLYVVPATADAPCTVLQLEIDEEGHFLDPWPEGFFEEDFRERFA